MVDWYLHGRCQYAELQPREVVARVDEVELGDLVLHARAEGSDDEHARSAAGERLKRGKPEVEAHIIVYLRTQGVRS